VITCDCGHESSAHEHQGLPADWCIWCTCDGMTFASTRPRGGSLGTLFAFLFAAVLIGVAVWVAVGTR
jgi:hypothetical protein